MPAAGSEVKDGNFMASILNLQRLYKACPGNRTMAINGCVISGLDPGAVPGVSTNFLSFGRGLRGRNRIDRRVKAVLLLGMVSAVIGLSV